MVQKYDWAQNTVSNRAFAWNVELDNDEKVIHL